MPARTKSTRVSLPTGPPGCWVIAMEGRHPVTINQLLNARHWAVRSRLKTGDRKAVYAACLAAGVTRANGKRQVGMTVVLAPKQRAADPDALWKCTLDSLVSIGALTDDNRQGIELLPVRYERGTKKRTLLRLEDIE